MNVWPVIVRELRQEARRPATYWLRVVSGVIIVATAAMLLADNSLAPARQGRYLFNRLNLTLFASIWVVVPLLAADGLSRERREGTLGLLFLTPLTAADIVVAKGLVHLLRAGTFLLAALPVLALPLLLGGIAWMDLVRVALLDLGALVLALTTGLLASTYSREWSRAMLSALVLSCGSAVLFVGLHGLFRAHRFVATAPIMTQPGAVLEMIAGYFWFKLQSFPLLNWGRGAPFASAWGGWGVADRDSVLVALGLLVFALGLSGLVLRLAARQVRRAWQEAPRTARQEWWLRTFCTVRFWRGALQHHQQRSLNRNPIGWLQQYSWSARLTKWGWCLGLLVAEVLLLQQGPWGFFMSFQMGLGALLTFGIAFSAAGSFRREHQTGALELILVSPLRVRQIMLGRLVGLWTQFLPALLLLGLVLGFTPQRGFGLYSGGIHLGGLHLGSALTLFLWLATVGATLPIVGLGFSFGRRSVLTNALAAWSWVCLMPWVASSWLMALLQWFGGDVRLGEPPGADTASRMFISGLFLVVSWLWLIGPWVLAWAFWRRLRWQLETRAFLAKAGAV